MISDPRLTKSERAGRIFTEVAAGLILTVVLFYVLPDILRIPKGSGFDEPDSGIARAYDAAGSVFVIMCAYAGFFCWLEATANARRAKRSAGSRDREKRV